MLCPLKCSLFTSTLHTYTHTHTHTQKQHGIDAPAGGMGGEGARVACYCCSKLSRYFVFFESHLSKFFQSFIKPTQIKNISQASQLSPHSTGTSPVLLCTILCSLPLAKPKYSMALISSSQGHKPNILTSGLPNTLSEKREQAEADSTARPLSDRAQNRPQ